MDRGRGRCGAGPPLARCCLLPTPWLAWFAGLPWSAEPAVTPLRCSMILLRPPHLPNDPERYFQRRPNCLAAALLSDMRASQPPAIRFCPRKTIPTERSPRRLLAYDVFFPAAKPITTKSSSMPHPRTILSSPLITSKNHPIATTASIASHPGAFLAQTFCAGRPLEFSSTRTHPDEESRF